MNQRAFANNMRQEAAAVAFRRRPTPPRHPLARGPLLICRTCSRFITATSPWTHQVSCRHPGPR